MQNIYICIQKTQLKNKIFAKYMQNYLDNVIIINTLYLVIQIYIQVERKYSTNKASVIF